MKKDKFAFCQMMNFGSVQFMKRKMHRLEVVPGMTFRTGLNSVKTSSQMVGTGRNDPSVRAASWDRSS